MDQPTIIKRYLNLQANEGSKNQITSETVGGCQAFAKAFREFVSPLPVDPVVLLIAYEQYQNQVAEEARKIDWLPSEVAEQLSDNLVSAIEATEFGIGCEKQEAADSVGLWIRGQANYITRSK